MPITTDRPAFLLNMLQIADMLSQAGDRIAVKHPVEIYAESFSG